MSTLALKDDSSSQRISGIALRKAKFLGNCSWAHKLQLRNTSHREASACSLFLQANHKRLGNPIQHRHLYFFSGTRISDVTQGHGCLMPFPAFPPVNQIQFTINLLSEMVSCKLDFGGKDSSQNHLNSLVQPANACICVCVLQMPTTLTTLFLERPKMRPCCC